MMYMCDALLWTFQWCVCIIYTIIYCQGVHLAMSRFLASLLHQELNYYCTQNFTKISNRLILRNLWKTISLLTMVTVDQYWSSQMKLSSSDSMSKWWCSTNLNSVHWCAINCHWFTEISNTYRYLNSSNKVQLHMRSVIYLYICVIHNMKKHSE